MAMQYDFQQTYYPNVEPEGSTFQLRPNGPWQIATIEIDNPTGRWVYIEPLSLYVPPYTIGWKKESRPWTVALECRWATPPAGGGVNVDDGTQLIVTLHSTYLGEDNGLTYKIATDTEKIITAIRVLRRGWGDLALDEDIHVTGPAGSVIVPDTGDAIAVSFATVRQDGVLWAGGGLQGFIGFSLDFAGGPGPAMNAMLAYPDQTMAEFLMPPRFVGTGDLTSSVSDPEAPSPLQQTWTIDVWYRVLP